MTDSIEQLYILRLYDMMDGWIDVGSPCTKARADAKWDKRTNFGKRMTCYADGDYFKVFPANTKMVQTPEFRGR